jgi:hypothetical protein
MENNMSQIQQNGSATTGNYYQGTSTKNNNGTMIAGGSSSTQLARLGVKRADVAVFASTVVERKNNSQAICAFSAVLKCSSECYAQRHQFFFFNFGQFAFLEFLK